MNINFWIKYLISVFIGVIFQGYFIIKKTPDLNHPVEVYIDSTAQINHILTQPIEYSITLINTVISKGWYLVESFFANVGWLDTPAPRGMIISFSLIFVGYILYVYISQTDFKKNLKSNVMKAVTVQLLVIVPCILLIFTSMYIFWTAPYANVIEGVQGRYFLPLLPAVVAIPILLREHDKEATGFTGKLFIGQIVTAISCALTVFYGWLVVMPRFFNL